MNPSQLYDAHYFAHGCGVPYRRDEHWFNYFGPIADRIIQEINPGSVLDAGCALGVLVELLRDRGVEAYGVDISDFAIGQVREDLRPHFWVGSVTDPLPQQYDLIICFEVLEHMSQAEAEEAIANLCQHTDDILFSSTPFDYKEATHFNVQPPEYWAAQFARYGFFRDVDFDASFITAWTVRFRRKAEPPHRLIQDYERKFWLLWKENTDLRELILEMRQQLTQADEKEKEQTVQLTQTRHELDQTRHELDQTQIKLDKTEAGRAEVEAERDWVQNQLYQHRRKFWLKDYLYRWGIIGSRPVRRLPPLSQPLSQTFVAEYGNLHAINLLVGNGVYFASYPLQARLETEEAEPIYQWTISPRNLPFIGLLTLPLPPRLESEGEHYRLTLQSPATEPEEAPRLWGYMRTARPDGQLQSAGESLPGELVMSITYGRLETPFNDLWHQTSWIPQPLYHPAALFSLGRGILRI